MSRRSLITAIAIVVLSLMTLAGLIMAVGVSLGGSDGLGLGGRIALVEVDGVIAGDEAFLRDVRRLRRDGSVEGWVFAINSPGGVVAPSQSMYRTLRRIREEDGVPVVAAIGAIGASGGYYVALGADSIMALPGSITGSIGVIMEYPNVSGLMEKVGVRMEIVKAGEQKDLGSPFRDLDPADREILESLVEDVHAQFIEAVSETRGLSEDAVRGLADGRVLTGRQARAAGLVDELGNLEEAIGLAGRMAGLGSNPRIARPPQDDVPWMLDALLGRTTARALHELVRAVEPATGSGPVLKYLAR